MKKRVAIVGIYHESNTFIADPTTLADFQNAHLLFGDEITAVFRNSFHEISGMLEGLESEGIEAVPVMFAEAPPGGIVSLEVYRFLLQRMMDALDRVLPVDGCLVVPHGAAVSEADRDMDGHWLTALRERVGDYLPIIGTLDAHANVSEAMANATNCLIAYKTNPHVDQRARGLDAALLMSRVLNNEVQPVQLLFQLPLIIGIERQQTTVDPCRTLYSLAERLCTGGLILSWSILLGFAYADVKEMGSSLLIVSNNDAQSAFQIGMQIRNHILKNKRLFAGEKNEISGMPAFISSSPKPVLLLDMGDNVGAGAPGDSTFLLDLLEQWDKFRFFICLHDPKAVARISGCREGEDLSVEIADSNKPGKQSTYKIKLLKLFEGKFTETKPRHGGKRDYDMGLTAVVRTERNNVVMLTSKRTLPFSLQQLLSFDIDPGEFDVIIAKGVNAPIAAYAPVCPTVYKVNTPGITTADLSWFTYAYRRIPMFPFEDI
jgi:microcystin degradation protein MlrC